MQRSQSRSSSVAGISGSARREADDPSSRVARFGAGDALAGAVIYALLNDIPVDEAVRLGVSAATLTLESIDTVRQDLSLESLYAQLVI